MPRVDDAYQKLSDDTMASWRSTGSFNVSHKERHQKVTVSREIAMWLNGEDERQMAHAMAIKKAGGVSLNPKGGSDTSVDQHWECDLSLGALLTDGYVVITTFLWLGVKIPVLGLFMLVATLPPMLIAETYTFCIMENTERFHRNCCFYFAISLCIVTGIPAILLITLSLILDYTIYYMLSLTFCLVTCRWRRAYESHKKIKPYINGPGVLLHLPDFFACVLGQCTRQTMGETWYMISTMFILIPWFKYYICCNPWIYDLDHRLCQPISTDMSDLGTAEDVADTCRGLISRAKQPLDLAERIDLWSFMPHYPYPPLKKRWALGFQAGGSRFPGKFTLVVHTTHALSEAGRSTEQLVISNSCKHPIYRVMLWYSNPFHFLTGWVEASISTGTPSQPDQSNSGEHPMWLVSGRTPLTSGKGSWTGSGMIDSFFDYWLPVLVHEMRREVYSTRFGDKPDGNNLALHYANSKYYDGISQSQGTLGVRKSRERDALSQFRFVGKQQRNMIRTHEKLAEPKMVEMGLLMRNGQQASEVEIATLACGQFTPQERPRTEPTRSTEKQAQPATRASDEDARDRGSKHLKLLHAARAAKAICRKRDPTLKEQCAQKFMEASQDGRFSSIVACRRRAGTLKEQCAQKFVESSQDGRFSRIVATRARAGSLKEQCAQKFIERSQDGSFSGIVANVLKRVPTLKACVADAFCELQCCKE